MIEAVRAYEKQYLSMAGGERPDRGIDGIGAVCGINGVFEAADVVRCEVPAAPAPGERFVLSP